MTYPLEGMMVKDWSWCILLYAAYLMILFFVCNFLTLKEGLYKIMKGYFH